MARPTALASLARYAVGAAEAANLPVDALLQRAGIPPEALEDIDGRVEVGQLLTLWELAAEASGDPFYGLHAAERFASPQTIHLVGHAARAAATLGEAIATVGRFARVMNETTAFELRRGARVSHLRVEPAPSHGRWPRVYAELVLAGYVRMGRFFTGVEQEVLGATFQHAAPADVSEYERMFGTTLKFGAPHNELAFRTEVLDLPVRFADAALKTYLDGLAAERLKRLSTTSPTRERVRVALSDCLASAPDLAAIARRLAMSSRTLQRRLKEEGVTYSEVLDEVRHQVAVSLVEDRRFSLAEIAALLGYADGSAFRSAFRRWTGHSPSDVRKSKGRGVRGEPLPKS